MAYALFEKDDKMSRAFATKEEALKKADEAGLVETIEGKPVLESDLDIKPCEPESAERDDEELDWVSPVGDAARPNNR